MNGAEVSVIDKADSHILCGAIKVTNILTAEGQTYTISCGLACGDGIVLSTVNGAKERCIAVFEMTATGYHGKLDIARLFNFFMLYIGKEHWNNYEKSFTIYFLLR